MNLTLEVLFWPALVVVFATAIATLCLQVANQAMLRCLGEPTDDAAVATDRLVNRARRAEDPINPYAEPGSAEPQSHSPTVATFFSAALIANLAAFMTVFWLGPFVRREWAWERLDWHDPALAVICHLAVVTLGLLACLRWSWVRAVVVMIFYLVISLFFWFLLALAVQVVMAPMSAHMDH